MAVNPIAVLGSVLLDAVEADSPSHTFDVTDKAVENGSNIADHMKERPPTLSITGVIVGDDAWPRLARIRQMQTNRQLITYVNRVVYSNMAITSISTEHGANIGNGFQFSIQMRHVRQASSQAIQMTSPAPVASKNRQQQNAGTQQVQNTDKQANNKEADQRVAFKVNEFGNIPLQDL